MRGLLLLVFIGSISFLGAQEIEHEMTRFYTCGSGQNSFLTGVSITDLDYVYTIHSFEEYSYTGLPQPFNFSTSNGDEDIQIIKTSKNDNNMWSKHIGGVGKDRPTGIEQLSNGDLIISGIFSDSVDFDPSQDTFWRVSQGPADNFLLKLDKDGNFIDCITFGGSGAGYLMDLVITENDEIFICGYFSDTFNLSPVPNQNIHVCEQGNSSYISKFDVNLSYLSSAVFEGDVVILDIHRTIEHTFLFTGYFNDTIQSVFANAIQEEYSEGLRDVIYGEMDDQLNLVSQKTIATERDEIGWFIGQLANGAIVLQLNFSEEIELIDGAASILVEGIYPFISPYPSNAVFQNTMLLCKLDEDVIWYKRFSGFGAGSVFPQTEFVTDDSGNLIASYYRYGQCDLGEENTNLIYGGQQRGSFLLKISETGNVRWVRRMDAQDSGDAQIFKMKLKGNDLYASGQFNGSVDFDLSLNNYWEFGTHEPFITKWNLSDQFLSIDQDQDEAYIEFYPNPANDILIVPTIDAQNLRVFDLSGREIPVEKESNGAATTINTSALSEASYLVSYTVNGEFLSQRFVVQH